MRKIIRYEDYSVVDFRDLHLTELFDLSDVEIKGAYWCSNNNLTSLVGAPSAVGGEFNCRENPLTSLEGIPKTINDHFFIDKSLKDKFPEEYIRSLSKIKGIVVYI